MILAGDVGGTKTRLALVDRAGGAFVRTATFSSPGASSLEALCQEFLAGETAVVAAAFGVAGPIIEHRATLVNLHWSVDGARLARTLGVRGVQLLNDLASTAHGLPHVAPENLLPLNPGAHPRSGNAAVIAAGTGLGQALIVRDGPCPLIVPTEAGHADFAARSDPEIALLRALRARFGHVSVERVLSGPGLVNVHGFLRDSGFAPEPRPLDGCDGCRGVDPAARVAHAGLVHDDVLAREALRMFSTLYGAEAGNLALRAMALSGVYVAGGIAPKIEPAIADGSFLAGFLDKGRLASLVRTIPVWLVRDPDTALRGAAAVALGSLQTGEAGVSCA